MGPIWFFLSMTVLTGVIYPLAITGIAQLIFPHQANGSLIIKDSQVIGSELIAQGFKQDKYFWPRPSASNYSAMPGKASNLPMTDPRFPTKTSETMSASGLDPHITLQMAREQIPRIALARQIDPKELESFISRSGKNYINVLLSNLELDEIFK